MQGALDLYQIDGVTTNIPFLSALFDHSSFKQGDFSTHFIDQHYPEGFSRSEPDNNEKLLQHCAAATTKFLLRQRDANISGTLRPATDVKSMSLVIIDNGEQFPVQIEQLSETEFRLTAKQRSEDIVLTTDWKPSQSVFTAHIDDHEHICLLYTSPSPRDATLSRMPSSA